MKWGRAAIAAFSLCVAAPASAQRADAILIVNSASAGYADAQHRVQPYLDHFGVPYTILDLATTQVPADIGSYALIIIGHAGLDVGGLYLDATEQARISGAVSAGTGLVNFDSDLTADGVTARYAFVQDVFEFGYGVPRSGSGILFTSDAAAHYVSANHAPGTAYATAPMNVATLAVPAGGTVLARLQSSGAPLLVVTEHGLGRAVQWATYDWTSGGVLGSMRGMDDLIWRAMAWAAREPFVMQGLPNFVTMRVDDVVGPLWWVPVANQYQLKPWLGVFHVIATDLQTFSSLAHAGWATVAVHARSGGDFTYFDHTNGQDFSDAILASRLQDAATWHTSNDIPFSKYVVPHFYEMGTNAFAALQTWGVEFIGIPQTPGQPYEGAPWLMLAPYRRFEAGSAVGTSPFTYGDYVTIPGHPELANRFFDCMTEIRDDAGYEWSPDNDVPGTIGRGTRQLRRALDGMALATLFTHEYNIQAIAPSSWQSIVAGVSQNVGTYDPIYVTMDYACQYLRAKHDSKIVSATFDPATQTLTADLSGHTDLDTQLYVFTSNAGTVLRGTARVPTFTGSTRVAQQIAGPLARVLVAPASAQVTIGGTQTFSAQGYDAAGTPISGLTYQWSALAGGTIDQSGRFTAGTTPGTFTGAVTASAGGLTGSATVQVYAQVLDHFGFDPVVGPIYAGVPFTVRVTGYDQSGATIPGFTGTAQLTDATGTVTPATTGGFSGGVWSGSVTIGQAAAGDALTASAGAASGTSAAFDVQAVPVVPFTLWPSAAAPARVDAGADSSVELGVKFTSDTAGYVNGIRFYKATTNTGAHVGSLWTSSGSLLATAAFANETASGWQQVSFAAPVPISANTTYVASYHLDGGHYSADLNYFAAAGVDSPPLHAASSPAASGNGVYAYGTGTRFPNQSYAASNYWVDVAFSLAPQQQQQVAYLVVTPASARVVSGGTVQFTARAYDAQNNPVTGAAIAWSAPADGTISSAGLFTAGATAGTFPNAVVATASGVSATAAVEVVGLTALTIAPTFVVRGDIATGTVALSAPAPADTTVTLASNTATAIVPASVVVPAGATTTAFGIATGSVAATTLATITATLGPTSRSATLSIRALSVSVNPTSVLGGSGATGTVAMSASSNAPVTVSLSTSNPAASVPSTVTIAVGATTATFPVTTTAVVTSTAVTVSATYAAVTSTATLTVTAGTPSALVIAPTAVVRGDPSTGTVTLSGPAPAAGAVVTLSSNSAAATVPASVTVAPGATTATFPITTSAVTANTNVTVSAAYAGVTRTATLSIRSLTVSLSPSTVGGGNGSTGTARLSGTVTTPTQVALSTSNPVATTPASVTIPAGATTATFPITTNVVTGTTSVQVRATYAGITASATLSVRVIVPSALSLSPTNVVGGAGSTGTVTLNYAAPAGGLTVTLASSRPTAATVPASLVVPAGSTTATFPVATMPVASNTNASISASANGTSRSSTLTITVPVVSGLSVAPATVTSGGGATGTVTLNGAAAASGRTVTLTSSAPAVATVPASVVVPAGATSATFPVTAGTVTASATATVTAATGTTSATAVLTVNP